MRGWALIPMGLGFFGGVGLMIYALYPDELQWLFERYYALDYPVIALSVAALVGGTFVLWSLFKFGIGDSRFEVGDTDIGDFDGGGDADFD